MDPLDTVNMFAVGAGSSGTVRVLNLPKVAAGMTSDEALNLAVWVFMMSCKSREEFTALADAVENT